jgi:hypothetical protein
LSSAFLCFFPTKDKGGFFPLGGRIFLIVKPLGSGGNSGNKASPYSKFSAKIYNTISQALAICYFAEETQ